MQQLRLDGQVAKPAEAALQPEPVMEIVDVPFAGHYGPRCVPCPEVDCHANVGARCKRPSGHSGPLVDFHASRKELAGRVRLIGLSCVKCGASDGPPNYVAPILECPDTNELGITGQAWCTRCVQALLASDQPSCRQDPMQGDGPRRGVARPGAK